LKNGTPKHKIVVGLGLYGRSFKLQSAAVNDIGSAVAGAGKAGKYTKEPGFLSYYEVKFDCRVMYRSHTYSIKSMKKRSAGLGRCTNRFRIPNMLLTFIADVRILFSRYADGVNGSSTS